MLFDVTHVTKFSYSRPVFLEPQIVRLRPRCDGSQRLLKFDMEVEPTPTGISESIELNGNSSTRMWFDGFHGVFNITTTFTLETLRKNPFDYILEQDALQLPVVYSQEEAANLVNFLAPGDSTSDVTLLAQGIAEEVDKETVPFLISLSRHIHENYETTVRHAGDPWPAPETLDRRKGACRDFAVLYMAACRSVGLAVRFVSGYQQEQPSNGRRELHAWAEVYLPGAGWRGFDPTLGVVVADRHVAVAAGLSAGGAAPTSGKFRGDGVRSTLFTEIRMKVTETDLSEGDNSR